MRKVMVAVCLLGVAALVGGCRTNSTGPDGGSGQGVAVRITASPQVGGSLQMGKITSTTSTLAAIESIRVNEAIIVIKGITFKSDIDTVHDRDSVEQEFDDEMEDHEGDEGLAHVHFRGPFVISLMNNQPVQVTVDTIPAGVYNGIQFAIHRLRQKDVDRNPALPDSLVGFSIVVTGSIKDTGGTWMPFEFKTDINQQFKVKGNFVVNSGDTMVPYVLQFNLNSWFTDPFTGRILDPNNWMDRWRIRWAIKLALGGHIRGGRDADDNGDPD